jgi:hypothetical protein
MQMQLVLEKSLKEYEAKPNEAPAADLRLSLAFIKRRSLVRIRTGRDGVLCLFLSFLSSFFFLPIFYSYFI